MLTRKPSTMTGSLRGKKGPDQDGKNPTLWNEKKARRNRLERKYFLLGFSLSLQEKEEKGAKKDKEKNWAGNAAMKRVKGKKGGRHFGRGSTICMPNKH